ncbi:TlpA family protein disulfide reductase [Asaia bogorensis]|uniref:TlpA family protein disulfide reductase n=1 Tax=Asaia bogorensis TaxID=91915 RepID=UPI00286284D5|nr:redoxin domain-containing protein [Asaia bogorensis]MDR6183084.1 thiol-disulfide isomerase/thioredoxin [Asaia bogorensis NBRC 16594]
MPGSRRGLLALSLLFPIYGSSQARADTAPAPDSAAFIAEDPALSKMVGRAIPALQWQTLDGQTLDLAALTRKGPVYLKLWATYCIPCRAQMPGFEALYQRYKTRMSVIAVDIGFGENRDKVAAFVKKTGLTMPVVMDDGKLSDWLQIRATPLHVLIDRDGRLAYLGHQDGPALDAALERVSARPRTAGEIHFADITPTPPLTTGERVPEITLSDTTGAKVPLRQSGATRSHKPQIVLFTAPWCESYLATMDPPTARACVNTRRVAQKLVGHVAADWVVVGARLWTEPADMGPFQTLYGPGFHVLLDRDNLAFTRFGVRQIPAVALITKDGRLSRMIDGSDPDLALQIKAFARQEQ